MSEAKVNSNGVNELIKVHILSDKEMREIGFTDYREGYWHFSKLYRNKKSGFEISFGVSINKEYPLDFRIDVLDEAWVNHMIINIC